MVILFACLSSFAIGQTRSLPPELRTSNTTIRDGAYQRNAKKGKEKPISVIYVATPNGILYGNPCAVEETKKMNFVYVAQKPGLPGGETEEDMYYNNTIVKLKLVFTRSPFWKLILNRRIKKCAQKTGDIVG